jgi:antirestriction protein
MIIMANKKELTIEELKVLYENTLKESKKIGEMLKRKEEEEEDRKAAQLALEKESRHKEVEEAYNTYSTLLKKYIEDYGSYQTTSRVKDYDWFPNQFWKGFF